MKRYFAYIRVSTTKQGEGVSLDEQQSAIKARAERNGITIAEWFEEKETAAKTGRAVFSKMLARLERGEAEGVIIHKIDRSARNLWDWATLSKLFDRGIDVQFAHESVDLKSRGGRLSADIMAIVAADYIRNLREEVKKGFYGRLKQGLYPLPAPIGYVDQGKGNPKTVDPERAPFIQFAFARYATGTISLKELRDELRTKGLRTAAGKAVRLSSLSLILNNPFYAGLIRIRRTGQTFDGKHEALISMEQFKRVQEILHGRTVPRASKHALLFRKLITCHTCGLHLIGELQKGHIYYRCHSNTCRGTSVREETIEDAIQQQLALLVGDKREIGEIRDIVEEGRASAQGEVERLKVALQAFLGKCNERLARLTDALIDCLIDKETFETRKRALLEEKKSLEGKLATASTGDLHGERALKNLELGNVAYSGYISADSVERRRIIAQFTSNLSIHGKNLAITLQPPYWEIANWRKMQNGAPSYSAPRTRARELLAIIEGGNSHAPFESASSSLSGVRRVLKRGRKKPARFARTSLKSPKSTRGSRPHSTRRPSTSRVARKAELPRAKRRVA